MVTGADLLAALRTVSLRPVSAAGVEFYVRGLTGAERQLLRDRAHDGSPLQAHELVGLVACNGNRERLFSDEQVLELAHVDGGEVEKIAAAILEASGLMPEAQEQAAKN
jgi:hypothetical protein